MSTTNNITDSYSVDRLVLGTVQLGLNYGINNSNGKPNLTESINLLNISYNTGLRLLDTAQAYGSAQSVIGEFHKKHPDKRFKVISKLSGNNTSSLKHDLDSILSAVNLKSLEGYLFHNFDDLLNSEKLFAELKHLKEQDLVKKIGVSLYTNEQIKSISKYKGLDIVQLPFNLLDNSSLRLSSIEYLKAANIEVHVRSIFLQGLFFKPVNQIPNGLSELVPHLIKLRNLADEAKVSIGTLAIGYVFNQSLIDKILIGVETSEQLKSNLHDIEDASKIDRELFKEIDKIFVRNSSLLNPVNWATI